MVLVQIYFIQASRLTSSWEWVVFKQNLVQIRLNKYFVCIPMVNIEPSLKVPLPYKYLQKAENESSFVLAESFDSIKISWPNLSHCMRIERSWVKIRDKMEQVGWCCGINPGFPSEDDGNLTTTLYISCCQSTTHHLHK